ncbi:hypothetical protein [Mucilaginibacter ginsenosidivorax]|uniref:SMODS and SLOG-associating 2TM effector domain-containing protein n=1 Tax=Mucilaginibacter ginsenosidivorax TaxID=862126 RepID=A0A5B8W1Z6_9SPHI|nr:hypothetical protein [Mucilaginibacter ginsenosidivorax]QEC76348.1 hypothetical protein FSB76_10470 [Mucilaginibacter ginsenosidivorax]
MTHKFITIAFAGKRDLPVANQVPEAIATLFAALDAEFGHTNLHLATGLAKGADQVVAGVFDTGNWLAEGTTNTKSMGAVIAFGKDDYLETLKNPESTEEVDLFTSLYDKCTHKLHLDGVYAPGVTGKPLRSRAHRQQGRFLTRMADVFVAVAAKNSESLAGGTLESTLCALQSGKPVILYNLADSLFYYYRDAISWTLDTEQASSVADIVKAFKKEFYSLKQDDAAGAIQSYHTEIEKLSKPTSLMFRLRKMAWFYGSGLTREPVAVKSLADAITNKRAELSNINARYQSQYRGGYMLNYLLASVAVFIAVMATCFYIYFPESCYWRYIILIMLGIVKVVLILIIISNTKTINNNNFNKMAIEYRYVSERLRANLHLAFAGIFKAIKPSLGNHNKNYLAAYPGEVVYQHILNNIFETEFEITLNSNDLLAGTEAIEKDWYQTQINYHKKETEAKHAMHSRLEHVAEKMGAWVLRIVYFELGLMSVELLLLFLKSHHIEIPGNIEHIVEKVGHISPVLLALTTLLPSLVITLISLNFQTEANRLSVRSERLINEINGAITDLDQKRNDLQKPERLSEGAIFMDLLSEYDKMSTITTDEVAEWSLLYEKNVPET